MHVHYQEHLSNYYKRMIFTFKCGAIEQTFAIKNHETQRSQWKGVEIELVSRYPTIPAAYTKVNITKDWALPNKVGFSNI